MNLNEIAEKHQYKIDKIVFVTNGNIVIKVCSDYKIAINRCDTAEKLLHWICHIGGRTWMTPDILRKFIEVACQESNIVMQDG